MSSVIPAKNKPFLRWVPAQIGYVLKSDQDTKPLAHIWQVQELWYGTWLAGGHQEKFESKEMAQWFFVSKSHNRS